jgi:hypothetical protein
MFVAASLAADVFEFDKNHWAFNSFCAVVRHYYITKKEEECHASWAFNAFCAAVDTTLQNRTEQVHYH